MTDETVYSEAEPDLPVENPVVEVVEGGAEIVPDGESSTPVEPVSGNADDAVQRRINKITAEKYAEKRRAEELERKIAELEGAKPALPSEAPKEEDYDYDQTAYNAALVAHEVQKQMALQSQSQQKQAQQTAEQTRVAEFAAKEAEYAGKTPGYAEAVGAIPHLQPETLDAVRSLGPQMAHYLGDHLDIAYEIANASPMAAAVRLGQLAATLAPTQKKIATSSAPEPVENLGGLGGASAAPPGDPRLDGVTFS